MHSTLSFPPKPAWFETWFDSPYYHILYDHRDEAEAATFIEQLRKQLNWQSGEMALDLACGKGRHSVMIAKTGLEVTGLDLSPQNIAAAKQKHVLDNLHFDIHDMRKVYHPHSFDYIFNLFTSFGYFQDREENLTVIQSAAANLRSKGALIIDFLNVAPIVAQLPQRQVIEKGDFTFHVFKELKEGMIRKEIKFVEPQSGEPLQFEEQVQAFRLPDFEEFFSKAGLTLKNVFGNYQLEAFDTKTSDRLILIGEK